MAIQDSISGVIGSYLGSSVFWIVIIIVLVAVVLFFYGYMSRRGKLKYICLEIVRFGNGKIGINELKAGLFKSRRFFFGLFDYGKESTIKTSDGRTIEQAKTSDLHDIFGQKGYICFRSPKDHKVLVPISRVELTNMNLVFEVAPRDYREASVRLFRESVEETKGTLEKLLPYIAVGFVVILTIISIVINMQMTNNTINKVGDMLVQGCTNQANVQGGTAP